MTFHQLSNTAATDGFTVRFDFRDQVLANSAAALPVQVPDVPCGLDGGGHALVEGGMGVFAFAVLFFGAGETTFLRVPGLPLE